MEYVTNAVGRKLPRFIEGYGEVKPYAGPFAVKPGASAVIPLREPYLPHASKMCASISEAIKKSGLKSGMTISFHHHLRSGDYVPALVMKEIAAMGIKNLTLAVSSFFTDEQNTLIDHFKTGVISGLETSGIRGDIGKETSQKAFLPKPIIFRTHGGRVRAIEAGDTKIDVAFIAAPACDEMGNMNGRDGKSAFGAMGYPVADSQYAGKVIAVTDNLVPYPLQGHVSINQTYIDFVVQIDSIGDPSKIATGATRMTSNPSDLMIAEDVCRLLIASGLVKEGFSFQAGAGGAALAVILYLGAYMKEQGIAGSFASGGITSNVVEMLEAGLFKSLIDTQTFDSKAAESFHKNANHMEMSAGMYANPHNKGCVAHRLDMMMLGATEIDVDFNINSLTGSTGLIMGALGGAPDTAAGAKLTVAMAPSIRKRIPIIVDKVTTVCTPGETVDAVVTDRGMCINPKRKDLQKAADKAGLKTMGIQALKQEIEGLTGKPDPLEFTDKIVGVVEYRDGTVLDLIYQVKP